MKSTLKPTQPVKTTLAYYAAFIALGMTSASLGPTLEALARQTTSEINQISWLFPVRAFGYLAGAVLAGRLYDRVRGHPLMVIALVLMGVSLALVPAMGTIFLLLVILLAAGLGEGLLDVGGNTLIVWLHGKKVGPFMNGLHFCFGLGALLAPLFIALSLDRTGGVAWAYWLIALAVIPAAVGLLRFGSPVDNNLEEDPTGARISQPGPGLVVLLVAFFFFYVGAEVGFGGWIALFSTTNAGISASAAAYLTSGFWGAFTAGRLIAIPISARLAPRRILLIDFTGALLSLGLILLWPRQLWAIWTGAIGFGLFIASIFPTMITYAGARMNITGRITGYFFFGATIGTMVLPWLIGQFFETVGAEIMTWTITFDLALAILAALGVSAAFRKSGHV